MTYGSPPTLTQAENDSLKGSIIDSLGDRGRVLVAKCVPDDMGGLVTANPSQATKVRMFDGIVNVSPWLALSYCTVLYCNVGCKWVTGKCAVLIILYT